MRSGLEAGPLMWAEYVWTVEWFFLVYLFGVTYGRHVERTERDCDY